MDQPISDFEKVVVIVLLALAGASIALFTVDRWLVSRPGTSGEGVRTLFANPFLKISAIVFLMFIAAGGYDGNVVLLVAATIAATVAGADFVLLLVAIVRNSRTFIQEFFQTQRDRLERAAETSASLWQKAAKERQDVQGGEGRTRAPDQHEMEETIRDVPAQVSILRVDDTPAQNQVEVAAFREMNFGIDVRTTNEAAQKAYLSKRYDLIISDIDRTPIESDRAGLELPQILEDAKPGQLLPPIIYYVHKVDATITEMGHPVVNTPAALLDAVVQALRAESGR